jgi:cytochrome P450
MAGDIFRRLVRMNDGAGHCPFKQAVSTALDSIDAKAVAQQGRQWSEQLASVHSGTSAYAWLDDYAIDMPVYVVASLLGIPAADLSAVSDDMRDFVACLAPGANAVQLEGGKSAAERLLGRMAAMLDASPSGLLLALADSAGQLGCKDDTVVAANAVGFMSQAYEATAGLIANTLYALAQDDSLRKQVTQDRSALADCAQEVLRFDPPVQNTRRFLAEDAEIAGQTMRAGDAILLLLASANRDETANPDAQRFILQRENRLFYTLGHGAHACPGRQISSLVAQEALARLLSMDLDHQRLQQAAAFRSSANIRMRLYGAV